MTTYISILRGINIAGKNKVVMADLKTLYESLGFEDVATYIQSGNVVFKGPAANPSRLAKSLEDVFAGHFNFPIRVLVLTEDELRKVINANPYAQDPGKDAAFFHVTFLGAVPSNSSIEKAQSIEAEEDDIQFIGQAAYLYCPNGCGRSKLTNNVLEAKLKVPATTRNWRTVNKLFELAQK